jgi:hypothetical protein
MFAKNNLTFAACVLHEVSQSVSQSDSQSVSQCFQQQQSDATEYKGLHELAEVFFGETRRIR